MSQDNALSKELVTKIHQFLLYQIETNSDLSEGSKESIGVAAECIEQSFSIEKKPASADLLNIYKNYKSGESHQQSGGQNQGTQNPFGQIPQLDNAIGLFQNIASSFLNQVPTQARTESTNPSNAEQSSTAGQTSAPPPTNRERKQATDDEKQEAENYKNKGNELMRLKKFKEAHESYSKAIELDANNPIYYSNRAAASSRLDDHTGALADCREAISIDPTYSKAFGRMGFSYSRLGDHQNARDAYKKANELEPENTSYKDNLEVEEEILRGSQQQPQEPNAENNMTSMLMAMLRDPNMMNMAMRTMQDPRLQGFFNTLTDRQSSQQQNQQQQPPPPAPRRD